MRLLSLTVQNFRSITTAYKLPLSSSTVLIGPNNEGKSNVMRALVLATRVLIGRRQSSRQQYLQRGGRLARETDYLWERDFPIHIQKKRPNGESAFVLEYELSASEIDEFKSVAGVRLNGALPIRVTIGKTGTPKVTLHKQGPASKALSSKAEKVAAFVAERVDLEYIPAVRTAESAQDVVEVLVVRELAALEDNPLYQQALEAIAAIQQPLLLELSESIKSTLQQFLPAVKAVDVRTIAQRRFEGLRRCEIFIDDGR